MEAAQSSRGGLPRSGVDGSMRPRVGVVVNPNASRDVRRLTSLARTIDVHERVNTVARVLSGLLAAGVRDIRFMLEPCRVVERAWDELLAAGTVTGPSAPPPVRAIEPTEAIDALGTTSAAAAMADAGVSCIVTVGGDGTNRAVAIGCGGATIVPVPGGTNNAFAASIEPTAAGLAAGLFAAEPERYEGSLRRAPRLEVRVDDGPITIALVDVALVREGWVGARATWDPGLLVEAVVARGDPTASGLAGIAGMLHPLDGGPPRALHIRFGDGGRVLKGALGPGRLVPLRVAGWRLLHAGDAVTSSPGPATISLDGEREIVVAPGRRVEIRLAANGPRVLDAGALLRCAAREGRFTGPSEAEAEGEAMA